MPENMQDLAGSFDLPSPTKPDSLWWELKCVVVNCSLSHSLALLTDAE